MQRRTWQRLPFRHSLTLHKLFVSEVETCDALVRSRHHVLEEQLALLVGLELHRVVVVEGAPEAVVHRRQQPVLPGELHLAVGRAGEAEVALEDGLPRGAATGDEEVVV